LIVEEAIASYGDRTPELIVDIGTGSGCLAVALALRYPDARLIATDVSPDALAVARRNAARHGVEHRITFAEADLMPTLTGVDLIVSNPPYVALGEAPQLAPEVRDHEPSTALFAGADGLELFRRLLPATRTAVTSQGRLIVEVGYDQHAAVAALAASAGWMLDRARHDLQGITRTLVFRTADDHHAAKR